MPFQKGNKLQPKKHSKESRLKISLATKGRVPWNKNKKSPQISGENNGMWKGEKAKYHAIHTWLVRNFGLAIKCESSNCNGKSKSFEYALKKGYNHNHNRHFYIQLCQSCHRKYDFTEKERKFVRNRIRKQNGQFK